MGWFMHGEDEEEGNCDDTLNHSQSNTAIGQQWRAGESTTGIQPNHSKSNPAAAKLNAITGKLNTNCRECG